MSNDWTCTLEGYEYWPGRDSFAYDLAYLPDLAPSELKALCDADERCVAFNTLGFVKYHVRPPSEFIHLPIAGDEAAGLYVKRQAYAFHPGMDSPGGDMLHVGSRPVDELRRIADAYNSCVGFNSRGDLKFRLCAPERMVTLPDSREASDGFYSKQRLRRPPFFVKLLGYHLGEDRLAGFERLAGPELGWGDIRLTDSDYLADYFAILNYPQENDFHIPERSVVFPMEPRREGEPGAWGAKGWGTWADPDRGRFLQVRSHRWFLNNLEWHLSKARDELAQLAVAKQPRVSAVLTDKYFDRGHRLRVDFLRYLQDHAPGLVDAWGACESLGLENYRGRLPPGTKDDGLFPYQYTLAVENNAEPNYATEKVVDAILAECLCFYWGCPNLEDWIDPDAFIRLDLSDFATARRTMEVAIAGDAWAQRLPAIRRARHRILDEYQLLPTLDRIVQTAREPLLDRWFDRIFVINLSRSKRRWHRMASGLAAIGVRNYERIDAVDLEAAAASGWPVPGGHRDCPDVDPLAQLACKLSHHGVLKQVRKRGYERVLIMEDDLLLDPIQIEKLNLALREIDDRSLRWDMLYLEGRYERLGEACGNNLHWVEQCLGTACYAVHGSACPTLLRMIESNPDLPIDDLYAHRAQRSLDVLAVHPWTVLHDGSRPSTIDIRPSLPDLTVRCLNLERRPDRRRRFEARMAEAGMDDFRIVAATDGRSLKSTRALRDLFVDNDFGWRRAVIGCALSHRGLWQQIAADEGNTPHLVFEDDAELVPRFLERLSEVLSLLDAAPAWEAVYLGHSMREGALQANRSAALELASPTTVRPFDPATTIGGSFAYLLRPTGARRLLAYLARHGIRHGIDFILMRCDHGLRHYEVLPHLAVSRYVKRLDDDVDSDIQKDLSTL